MTDVSRGGSETVEPLSPDEEVLWRSLGRLTQLLPRRMEEDMTRAAGLTMTEFGVLQSLADAPDGRLRMSDLAEQTALSPSRMTRLVDDLVSRGWLAKERDTADARSTVAGLTPDGERRRRAAHPQQVLSARRRVLDQVPAGAVRPLGELLQALVEHANVKG